MLIAIAAAGALHGVPALAQQDREARDEPQRQVEHERHRISDRRSERRYPQGVTKVGEPNPYEPKVGAPNPYATQGGTPNPYATQGGTPNPYATQGGVQPQLGSGAPRR